MNASVDTLDFASNGSEVSVVLTILSELKAAGSFIVAKEVHLTSCNDGLVGHSFSLVVVWVNGLGVVGLHLKRADGGATDPLFTVIFRGLVAEAVAVRLLSVTVVGLGLVAIVAFLGLVGAVALLGLVFAVALLGLVGAVALLGLVGAVALLGLVGAVALLGLVGAVALLGLVGAVALLGLVATVALLGLVVTVALSVSGSCSDSTNSSEFHFYLV